MHPCHLLDKIFKAELERQPQIPLKHTFAFGFPKCPDGALVEEVVALESRSTVHKPFRKKD